jgi:hypothetical protein
LPAQCKSLTCAATRLISPHNSKDSTPSGERDAGWLLYCRPEKGVCFAVELGARHREPLGHVFLLSGVTEDVRFSTDYSLAVEELCGAQHAERQFAIDVESLNRVAGPRWGTLGLVLNFVAPVFISGLYFGLVFFVAGAAVSVPAVLAILLCSFASLPIGSFFRRRETRRFLLDMAGAVDELQTLRGSDAWHWLFWAPSVLFDRSGLNARRRFRKLEWLIYVSDLLFHTGPRYSVSIVAGVREASEGGDVTDALL